MYTLLLFISAFFLTLPPEDCSVFYDKSLKQLSVNGELTKKESLTDYYIFTVKNKTGETIPIKILKTNTGIKLYMFAKEKSLIIKVKNEKVIRVAVPSSNGGYTVQIFPDLCE